MNTMQQEFDAVVAHLFTQGRPARDRNTCRYRAGELSCAVGCRIPDEAYDVGMDDAAYGSGGDTGVFNLIKAYASVIPEEIIEYPSFFKAMQVIHDFAKLESDRTFDLAALTIRLMSVADDYKLILNIPTKEQV